MNHSTYFQAVVSNLEAWEIQQILDNPRYEEFRSYGITKEEATDILTTIMGEKQ